MIPASAFAAALDLETVVPPQGDELEIESSNLNRPGLQFAGFFEYFPHECVQILGKVEMTYLLSLSHDLMMQRIDEFMSRPLPAVVICRNMACPEELLAAARRFQVPLYRTRLVTTKFSHNAINFINNFLAPRVTRHGVLIDVYGVGIMITGDSGIGKSESALELVKRGHQLVADDVVDIRKVADERLIGESPETIRHFMEIRGIGIIDVKAMYGVGAVINRKSIDVVIHLEIWDSAKEYDRLGLSEEYINILGVKLPKITLPVRPGRNLAIIIEIAARNYRLKMMGYNAAREFDARLSARFGPG